VPPLLIALAACVESGTVVATAAPIEVALSDANQLSLNVSFAPYRIALDLSREVRLDWVGLERDVYGRPLSTNVDIHQAWIFWGRGSDTGGLFDLMAAEALDQAALSVFAICTNDEAACQLRDFRILDGANDVPERIAESGEAWGLVLVNPADGGLAAVHELVASPEGGVADVDLSAGSPLEVAADWGGEVVTVPAGAADITLDWSAVTGDPFGGSLVHDDVDSLFVVHSAGSAEELAAHAYDLDAVVDARWTLPLRRETRADLSLLTGSQPFSGISTEGTWAVGLGCSNCITPAPRLLTLLRPD
jgi:hypothetical protein